MLDFQTLLHRLKTQIDTATGVLNVAGGDLEKLIRYSFSASSNSSARTRSTLSTRYVDEVAAGTELVLSCGPAGRLTTSVGGEGMS